MGKLVFVLVAIAIALTGCQPRPQVNAFAPQQSLGGGTLGGGRLGVANPAVVETDCETLAAEVWESTGTSMPFDVAAADTDSGDACNPFTAKHPVRQ
jgi:hypothetical protein